jgi:hypothetical protein
MNNNMDLTKFNSFIELASQNIMCDADCQKQKQYSDLQNNYLNAKMNLAVAPTKLEDAEKKFIIYSKGEQGYDTFNEENLKNKATQITNLFKQNFEKDSNETIKNVNSYNALSINYNNVSDLLKKYKKENDELFKRVKNNVSDYLTNERKTYYENENINHLKYFYYYILLFIYYLFVIVYIFMNGINHDFKYFMYLFFLVILPFLYSYILSFIIIFIGWIYSMINF